MEVKCPNCGTLSITENKIQVTCLSCDYVINLEHLNENKDKKINLNEVIPKQPTPVG